MCAAKGRYGRGQRKRHSSNKEDVDVSKWMLDREI
jgi:hypothetical protein